MIECTNCHLPYPQDSLPYRCPRCSGIFDFTAPPPFDRQQVDPSSPGMWRYRHTFDLPDQAPVVTLGEGDTPLVWAEAFQRQVAFKLENLNPTGSFKDRGSAVVLSLLKARGVTSAVEDSSGNAGASFAAYAARASIHARVFVPDSASGPKRRQIEAYGAELVRVMGPRSNAAEAVMRAADAGQVYASHAFLPMGMAGYATIAYELFEQMGRAPAAVITPVGQGGLLLGLERGFRALQQAGMIKSMPRLVGVQARACAPLWAVYQYGTAGLSWTTEGETLAEGVRVLQPARGDSVLRAVSESDGLLTVVDEEDILPGRDELARRGLYVEPTSALVWQALKDTLSQLPDPVAVILTGSGLKHAG